MNEIQRSLSKTWLVMLMFVCQPCLGGLGCSPPPRRDQIPSSKTTVTSLAQERFPVSEAARSGDYAEYSAPDESRVRWVLVDRDELGCIIEIQRKSGPRSSVRAFHVDESEYVDQCWEGAPGGRGLRVSTWIDSDSHEVTPLRESIMADSPTDIDVPAGRFSCVPMLQEELDPVSRETRRSRVRWYSTQVVIGPGFVPSLGNLVREEDRNGGTTFVLIAVGSDGKSELEVPWGQPDTARPLPSHCGR